MSVLIKGMEMPTDCIFCLLCRGDWQMCSQTESSIKLKGRPSDCPLVSVPPHGRLGDLDALLQSYDKEHIGPPGNARRLIETANTIIPAEGQP